MREPLVNDVPAPSVRLAAVDVGKMVRVSRRAYMAGTWWVISAGVSLGVMGYLNARSNHGQAKGVQPQLVRAEGDQRPTDRCRLVLIHLCRCGELLCERHNAGAEVLVAV